MSETSPVLLKPGERPSCKTWPRGSREQAGRAPFGHARGAGRHLLHHLRARGGFVMEGRWIIQVCGHDAVVPVGDPCPTGLTAVPVVPCDDAAIERAARRLAEEFTPIGEDGEPTETLARQIAEAVLRAAGETR